MICIDCCQFIVMFVFGLGGFVLFGGFVMVQVLGVVRGFMYNVVSGELVIDLLLLWICFVGSDLSVYVKVEFVEMVDFVCVVVWGEMIIGLWCDWMVKIIVDGLILG